MTKNDRKSNSPKSETADLPNSGMSSAERERESVPRLSLPLKDGGIDYERMQTKTRDALKSALADGRLLRELGIGVLSGAAATTAAPLVSVFSEQWCSMIYDALGQVEIALACQVYRCSRDQAAILLFTEPEKRMLVGPTSKVLDKYASTWLTAYGDEIALAAILGTTIAGKVSALRTALDAATVVAFQPGPHAVASPQAQNEEPSQ